MIRIQKEDVADIASYWAFWLKAYLYNDLGSHKVKYTDSNKVEHEFSCRIEKYKFIYEDKCRSINSVSNRFKNLIWRKISDLLNDNECLKGSKDICIKYMKYQQLYLKNHNDILKVINYIFVDIYNDFSDKIAYDIFKMIGLKTCPYCNRHYTFTLSSESGKFKTRPEFDHFYDKRKYPMLAVTFFNLVPSCKECNLGKLNNPCGVNPYFDAFTSKFVIAKPKADGIEDDDSNKLNINEVFKISTEDDFNVDFECRGSLADKDAEELNINNLGLRELYNEHKDYVMEIVDKVVAYNVLARKGIVSRFQGICHSESDVYNLIFGKYLSDAEQPNRPLSKLTADILDQLQIRVGR